MEIYASTLSAEMEDIYDDFQATFGFGPCGAYSALQRSRGNGQVAVCIASDGRVEFPHYINIVDGNGIVDFTNPMDSELTYREIEILDDDEMPDLVDDAVIRWIAERC